jgi:hypothetical protein
MRRMPAVSRVSKRPTNSSIDRVVIFTAANQCILFISASMRKTVCLLRCIGTLVQLIAMRNCRAPSPRKSLCLASHAHLIICHALPAAERRAQRPHLQFVETVSEAVLVEAGAPLMQVCVTASAAPWLRATARYSFTDPAVLPQGKASIST